MSDLYFDSYYWAHARFSSDVVTEAVQCLSSMPNDMQLYRDATRTLLKAGDVAAAGIALDHWSYRDSVGRWGAAVPDKTLIAPLLMTARSLLARPPLNGTEGQEAASYASALLFLWSHGEGQDARLVDKVLQQSDDSEVIQQGLRAANTVLLEATEDHGRSELLHTLGGIPGREKIDAEQRAYCLLVLGDYESTNQLFVQYAMSRNLVIATSAAIVLGERDLETHRNVLRQLLERWPKNASDYRIREIESMLQEEDRC